MAGSLIESNAYVSPNIECAWARPAAAGKWAYTYTGTIFDCERSTIGSKAGHSNANSAGNITGGQAYSVGRKPLGRGHLVRGTPNIGAGLVFRNYVQRY